MVLPCGRLNKITLGSWFAAENKGRYGLSVPPGLTSALGARPNPERKKRTFVKLLETG
jgi:hypothetical protein